MKSSEKPRVLQPWDESRAEGRFRSYFVSTAGDVSSQVIEQYIEKQRGI